jgi:type IV pilus assembly protein PilB
VECRRKLVGDVALVVGILCTLQEGVAHKQRGNGFSWLAPFLSPAFARARLCESYLIIAYIGAIVKLPFELVVYGRNARYHTHKMPIFDEKDQNRKLEELRQKEEEGLASILSAKYGIKYADLSRTAINTDALRLIEEKDARDNHVAAIAKFGKKITLAVRAPESDGTKRTVGVLEERGYQVTLVMVSSQSLERAWQRYADLSFAVETQSGVLDISGEEILGLMKKMGTLISSRDEIATTLHLKKSHRISRIVEIVIAGGLANRASDIHIEPEENAIRLRFRLDGVLVDVLDFDHETYALLLSRIKLLSGLKLNLQDRAQDGRFSVQIDTQDIEIRTSLLPGAYGESIVMRLLDPSTLAVSLEELGIEPKLLAIIEKEIRRPNGMILSTGPTGSGKTTTLYAILKKIHSPGIKIITIEDPIEYHMEGIVQTQVDEKNYTFASGLRSGLRQDPDVIMVGEIRDSEVAETAIHASLTGHLVLSTLHTNNAAGAFPRLLDLGVNSRVVGSSVRLVLAQRLVRKLRDDSKQAVTLEGEQKKLVDAVLASITDKSLIPEKTDTVWEPIESPETGIPYRGRIGVFEAIFMDTEIERQVEQGAGERDIKEAARRQGILTMKQDGILKALRGVTSLSELSRVIDLYDTETATSVEQSSP